LIQLAFSSQLFPWKVVQPSNSDPVLNYGMHGQVHVDGSIWLFGGVPENRTLVNSEEFWTGFAGANNVLRNYNVQTKVFTVVNAPNPPPARSFFDMVRGPLGFQNSLFLFGGQGLNPTAEDSKDLGDLWRFDINTQQWTNLTSSLTGNIPSPRTGAAMVTMPNGKIYIFGGVQGYANFLSDLFAYNPNNNTIVNVTPGFSPPPRGITNIVRRDNSFFIANGCCNTTSETGGYYQDMWKYNPNLGEWSEVNQKGKVYSSTYAGSVLIGNNWLFQGGDLGGCEKDLPLYETSYFDFQSETWARGILPRYASGPLIKNAKLSFAEDEKIYQFGGYSSGRSDDGWCTSADQDYKNLIYKYDNQNLWFILSNIAIEQIS
jgi:N-acetylneuraminic acid mutarotase